MSFEILKVLLATVTTVRLHETLRDIPTVDCHNAVFPNLIGYGTFLKFKKMLVAPVIK
jgi:hypothetical protein